MGTLSEGNTKIVTSTNNKTAYTTINIPSTGKWYWEVDMTSYASGGGAYFGLHEYNELNTGNSGVTAKAVIFQNYNGTANVYDSASIWESVTDGGNYSNTNGDNIARLGIGTSYTIKVAGYIYFYNVRPDILM